MYSLDQSPDPLRQDAPVERWEGGHIGPPLYSWCIPNRDCKAWIRASNFHPGKRRDGWTSGHQTKRDSKQMMLFDSPTSPPVHPRVDRTLTCAETELNGTDFVSLVRAKAVAVVPVLVNRVGNFKPLDMIAARGGIACTGPAARSDKQAREEFDSIFSPSTKYGVGREVLVPPPPSTETSSVGNGTRILLKFEAQRRPRLFSPSSSAADITGLSDERASELYRTRTIQALAYPPTGIIPPKALAPRDRRPSPSMRHGVYTVT
ncbi:hypothetical protein B0H17DRAFT_1147513 [Mycena rosella]|uniref:Uncharacterized protein n=1 Tax=Mycena rosella TaxID=1033263 RepID=A0AAD7FZQ7_MYCRO|nr:hypothetical protein B0H17DRAFT_1147513 [Mycena rosella]